MLTHQGSDRLMQPVNKSQHPGIKIRLKVIPTGMSVTKAAQLMGIGRPALSNLLNGKASLSAEMAGRLSKAFDYPLGDLMAWQASFDSTNAAEKEIPADTGSYVPPFLAIKANDIEDWASHNIPARSRLSVLLRTLVHSTGRSLEKVDFPGNDDAERPGWDGFIEAKIGTPWIPAGVSGWEFGTNADPRAKAEGDFQKSVSAVKPDQQTQMTFVFVTPRRWSGKAAWVKEKSALKIWKEVRAYDASDLEQWLEQSLPGQVWLANERKMPNQDVRSLDQCWSDWANVTNPTLSPAFFLSAVESARRTILSILRKPAYRPIVLAADSTEEGLAFLAQLFNQHSETNLYDLRDRVLVFDKVGALPRVAMGANNFIAVVHGRDVERELGQFSKSVHSIVVYPLNAASTERDIVLGQVPREDFDAGLDAMGKGRDEIARLTRASGRSLTVLRRQLSDTPAIRVPDWAADPDKAANLIPFMLVGAWNSHNEADRDALALLADSRSYDELERQVQKFVPINDPPLWSAGSYRGVVSKIDLLFAIANAVTAQDLQRYFQLAKMVLGEDDPTLDIPEDKRSYAGLYGKSREFSSAFREGISETLVLLSLHGADLFDWRLGVRTGDEVTRTIKELLPDPLTTRVLEANDRDLPTYAEAHPDEFLSIIERDLRKTNPAAFGLLRPVDSGIFGAGPSRTGLLWALEGLAWSPSNFPRAVMILARLAQVEIVDNWVNKPINSLKSIFRSWMPQTAASLEDRLELMKKMSSRFPDVAWKICISEFGNDRGIGDYTHKPRWRPDGFGFGEPLPTWGPILEFRSGMVEMAISWKEHTLVTLSDLVERLDELSDIDQTRIWNLIEAWASTKALDAEKAQLREKIRVSLLSRRAAIRGKKKKQARLLDVGRAVYAALEPVNAKDRHAWLFKETWVEESADEIDDLESFDYRKRDERISALRTAALKEIVSVGGPSEILELAFRGKASWVVGVLCADGALSEPELEELLRLAVIAKNSRAEAAASVDNLIAGALRAMPDQTKLEAILNTLAQNLEGTAIGSLYVLAPYNRRTWALVDRLDDTIQAKYWGEIVPDGMLQEAAELTESVERLLAAERPRAAFASFRFSLEKVDSELLFRVMAAVAKGGNEIQGEYPLDSYEVESAFKKLNQSGNFSSEQMAGLEFPYIDIIGKWGDQNDSYGIPNLERQIELHPELFVQAVAWTYKRKDGAADHGEYHVPADRLEGMAHRGYRLLDALRRIPGHDDLGELQAGRLLKWIETVRLACRELARQDVGDICIGTLLSHSMPGLDGVWPCEAVRDALEEIQSEVIMRGAITGVYNSRGVHFRGSDGQQERELADKYRIWSKALQVSHPFVSAGLLMAIAKSYDRDAHREDDEGAIRRRLI